MTHQYSHKSPRNMDIYSFSIKIHQPKDQTTHLNQVKIQKTSINQPCPALTDLKSKARNRLKLRSDQSIKQRSPFISSNKKHDSKLLVSQAPTLILKQSNRPNNLNTDDYFKNTQFKLITNYGNKQEINQQNKQKKNYITKTPKKTNRISVNNSIVKIINKSKEKKQNNNIQSSSKLVFSTNFKQYQTLPSQATTKRVTQSNFGTIYQSFLTVSSFGSRQLSVNRHSSPKNSNKKIIINALKNSCYPGQINKKYRQKYEQIISNYDAQYFILLFKQYTRKVIKGIYYFDCFSKRVMKVFGDKCKDQLFEEDISMFFRYDSGGKEFKLIDSCKTFSLAVHGLCLK